MKITKIEQQKKNPNRSSVSIDGHFAFGIDRFDLFRLKLKEGDEIDAARLADIKENVLLTSAKNYGMKLTAARSYTVAALTRKMQEKQFDESSIEKTVAFLKEYRLLDDEEYARRFIHDCIHLKGYGEYRIKNALWEKGIEKGLAERVLAEFDLEEAETETLLRLAEKKLGGDFSRPNLAKTKRYLVARGFRFDAIDRAIRTLCETGGEEWNEEW